MSKKKQSAKRKTLFSLTLYLQTKAKKKAEKLLYREEKRNAKSSKGHKHEHNHEHEHEHELHESSESDES